MKRQLVALGSVVVLAAVLVMVGTGARGADHAGVLHPSRVVRASGADRSLPLRDLTAAGGESADPDQSDVGGKRPSHEGDAEDDLHRPAPRTSSSAAHERDAALQSSTTYHASATASPPAMPNFN